MVNEIKRGKLLKRAGLVILMGACAMLMSSTQASAVLIDHWTDAFDCGTGSLSVNAGNPVQTDTQSGLAVRGGTRVTTLTFLSGPLNASADSRISFSTFVNTLLAYNNDTGVTSKLDSFYNGGGAGLGDLTTGGATFVSLALVKADLNAKLAITVTDTASNSATVTNTVSSAISPPGMTLFFPFSSFTGVNFASVKSINLDLTQASGDSVDYFVDILATGNPVPEPLTMLGMVFGLGSVGAYIRKRRMA